MEIKQEASEKTSKIEIDNETCDVILNAFKIDIKEEPKKESIHHTFDYLDFNEFPVHKNIVQDDYKFTLFEEKQTNEKNTYTSTRHPLSTKVDDTFFLIMFQSYQNIELRIMKM
ncbi:unnamed protein product [Diabrotica balteata]|uniref:Uncharacterized protein n=1 Tax=Diabrotica balteata TaxID=107213 RepID=A0A9N9TAH0_DIABA|nr:unnamed protein product [Diabrotica balteata]